MGDVDILLVEDNHGDVHMVEWSLDERDLPGTVHVVGTGDAALDWLYQRGDYSTAPRPDIVLLDLNLPAISGHDVLETIKSDRDLKRVPVIVLTSSDSEDDVLSVYENQANACLIKPVDPEEFADLVQSFVEFWVTHVKLPPDIDVGGDAGR